MKPGDLVRLKTDMPNLGIFEGDLAILTEIDWDERDYPNGLSSGDSKITGRGFFFFPDRQQVHERFRRGDSLGIMLLYNNFEVLVDDHNEDNK